MALAAQGIMGQRSFTQRILNFLSDERFLCIVLFLLPSLIGLQPFFPKLVQGLLLYGRVIIAPIIILLMLQQSVNYLILGAYLVYISIITLINFPSDINDGFIVYFSLFASIAFHKYGQYISNKAISIKPLTALANGTALVNVITIVVYYLLGFGYIDLEWFLTITGKGFLEPLFRFSLGNAIELPLAITCLLYISILLLRKRRNLLYVTGINLFAAILCQSRLIVFIALLIFLVEFWRSDIRKKMVIITIVIACTPILVSEFGFIVESFFNRLAGDDMGSKDDRSFLFELVFSHSNPMSVFTGNGITSSSELVKEVTGVYRTVESIFLQMFYELGIIGGILFLGTLYIKKNTVVIPRIPNVLPVLLIYVQVYFFISIYTLLPIIFLLFGISETMYRKNSKVIL